MLLGTQSLFQIMLCMPTRMIISLAPDSLQMKKPLNIFRLQQVILPFGNMQLMKTLTVLTRVT